MKATNENAKHSNATAGHTPGPWQTALPLGYDATPFPVSDARGFRVAWVNPMATSWSDGKAEANARLIAAAPELYAELKRATDMLSAVAGDIEDGYSLKDMRGKMVMAIINARDSGRQLMRKAEGRP